MKNAINLALEGTQYDVQGNFLKAIEWYDRSIQSDGNFKDAWKLKGNALCNLGRNEEAIQCFDRTIAIDGDDIDAWNAKGFASYNLGRKEEAIGCYDQAITIDGNFKDAWYNKGYTLYYVARYKEAIACYDRAITIAEDSKDAWNGKGFALNHLGRYEEAIECYDRAIMIDGNFTLAWNNKGIALLNLGRNEEAIECYDRAILTDEKYKNAWNNKGNALDDLGRKEEAIECYDQSIAIDGDDKDVLNNKGFALLNLGRNEEAIKCYDQAIAVDPQYILAMCNKAVALKALGRNEEAFDWIQHVHALYRQGTYSSENFSKGNFAYIERQFSLYRNLLDQVEETFSVANKAVFEPKQHEIYVQIRRIVQDECIPLFNPYERFGEQDAEEKEQRILNLLARVREFEQNAVRRSEVSHAIRVNPHLEQQTKDLKLILSNPALRQYYDTLNQLFNQAFVGAMAAESGLVQQSSQSNLFLSIAAHAPIIGKAFEFLNFSFTIWKDIQQTNRIARFNELAKGAAEMEAFIEQAAIRITLEKSDSIQNAHDDRGKLRRYFDTLRGTVLYSKCNTPAKRMAVEDVTRLLQASMCGSIHPTDDIPSAFVYIALHEELISYAKPSCCLIL